MLPARLVGPPGPLSVVGLHGFTQDGRAYREVSYHLGSPVLAVDLPGHGLSGDLRWGIGEVVGALARALPVDATVVGYSMGARIALHLALDAPAKISRLVLISGTAGLEGESRDERRSADETLACEVEAASLGDWITQWLDAPMFAGLAARGEGFINNEIRIRSQGSRAGLAWALRAFGQGTLESRWDDLETLGIPTTLIVGGNDLRYLKTNRKMARLIPNADLVVLPEESHSVLGGHPEVVASVISEREN